MRPATFEDFAISALAQHKTIAGARPLRDIGEQRYPYGVAIRLQDGTEYRWQITAESAPGDNYATPEQPVEGDAAPVVGMPELVGPIGDRDAEQFLAHILTAAASRELASVSCWSALDPAGTAGPYGLTIRCHSGATVYCRATPVPTNRR